MSCSSQAVGYQETDNPPIGDWLVVQTLFMGDRVPGVNAICCVCLTNDVEGVNVSWLRDITDGYVHNLSG